MRKKLSATVRVIRWNGHELRYNDEDKQFIHEMLSHNLGFKNAQLITTNQCGKDSYQCVIADLDPAKEEDDEHLQSLTENVLPIQRCFLVEMPRDDYEALLKARRKSKNNVFDLYMGLYDDETTFA